MRDFKELKVCKPIAVRQPLTEQMRYQFSAILPLKDEKAIEKF